jgi:release factor glutamine methyltransferase
MEQHLPRDPHLEEGVSIVTLTHILESAGIGDAYTCRYEAEILVSHFCHLKRAEIPLQRSVVYQTPELLAAVKQRLSRYPLQYIIGEWQFCNETYHVSPDCLIPRADTEILVETAAEMLPQSGRFIDLCTGSGCIAISLLAMRKDATGDAVDLYPNTLAVAEKNAARNGVADRFKAHLFDVLHPEFMESLGKFDLILSNPPYIPTKVVDGLAPEVGFEPRAALDGGNDGLVFYRALLALYPQYLAPSGKMILEIGYDQGELLRELAHEHHLSFVLRKDLGGCDRVVILSRQT